MKVIIDQKLYRIVIIQCYVLKFQTRKTDLTNELINFGNGQESIIIQSRRLNF